ncbi:coiled-coil domain-containing protein 120 isoform X1 [Pygocentrus nattereri]|uniref:coiled-coil domain-containing protein 120 isoform X1 n=1 Tax=Pygocentrus nattereri TaxID=42514 RepID=UPI001890F80B|nr:coiled-coil domain-containing protein 120 isoform X1 [Pygocentrus nattereri]XP_037391660.1 coiled-coil domain-containing protein 120 isoform X1 [Pygocentrus nattereri]
MATGPTLRSTYERSHKVRHSQVNLQSAGSEVTQETHDMEVKGHLITGPELQGCMDSKQRAERMVELQERRRSLQALLSTRLAELRRVCLQEAELTGEVPSEFPLEAGEKLPHVRRRVGLARSGSKYNPKSEEDDASQRKTKKPLFSGALRRHTDAEQQPTHGKRTVHRGCHTDNTVKSESSSTSDSTSQENEDTSDGLSPSRPRLVPGSPDSRFCRKLSPVEIYYEMRARRNSVASSASPSRSLPRSMSNLEGRSVPATPLLTRNGPNGVHIRSESSSSTAGTKQWPDNPEVPQLAPVPTQEGSSPGSYEQNGCTYSTQTRRSNSSEALLDRNTNTIMDEGGQRSGLPVRNGPYKSSEALPDGRLKQAQRGSPERQVNGHTELSRVRSVSSGRAVNGSSAGYSEILLDYVWGKQQKMQQAQQQQLLQQRLQAQNSIKARAWPETPSGAPPPYMNGFHQSQALILASGPPAYSPLMLRGKPGEPRRVKVTRTKSCGPFIPLQQHQQETVLISAYAETPTTNGTSGMGHYSQADQPPGQFQPPLRPPQYSADPPTGAVPDESTRNLHKALALEGLRDWYLRNALGQTGVSAGKGQEVAPSQRRRTTASLHGPHPHPPLKHQPQSFQGDTAYPQLPQSATFHGHPIHGRSVDLSPYQDTFPSKMQDLTLKETNNDRPSPGTLV